MSTNKLPSKGSFDCPSCRGTQPYRKHTVSGGLTIAGLSLWRWGRQEEFVECQTCHYTFVADVLLPESRAWSAEPIHLDAAMRVMLLMMLADGEIAADEITTIQRTWKAIADKEIRESAIRTQAEHAKADRRGIEEYISGVSPMLTERGKTVVLRSAMAVAAADGEYHADEQALMKRLVGLLGLPEGILDTLDVPMPPPAAKGAPPPPVGLKTVTPAPAPGRDH